MRMASDTTSEPGPDRADDRADVGGVARREHQSRRHADEFGELGLELLVQVGVAGDQARPGRSRPPGAQRRHAGVDHGRMPATAPGSRWTPSRARRPPAAAVVTSGAIRRHGVGPRNSSSHASGAVTAYVSPGHSSCSGDLNTVQVSARATATIADVICVDLAGRTDVRRHHVDQVAERTQPDAVVQRHRRGDGQDRRVGRLDDADRTEHSDVGDTGQAPRRLQTGARPARSRRRGHANPGRAAARHWPPTRHRPARWP